MDEFEMNDSSLSIFRIDIIEKIKQVVQYITLHFSSWMSLITFFGAVLLIFSVGVYPLLDEIVDKHWNFFYKLFKNCHHSLPEIPDMVLSLMYEAGFIPILSAIIPVFICTYHCDSEPGVAVDPYPPLDIYTQISCRSATHIICFVVAAVAIMIYFPRSLTYILRDTYSFEDAASKNIEFQLFEQIMRVCCSFSN